MTITTDDQQIRDDAATGGRYPLITNGQQSTDLHVVEARHGQPHLERRHHILKGAQDGAPIWINNIDRIEAVFCCHFTAQLIGALIERQNRAAMAAADIAKIPVYPELRGCTAPSAGKILQIFGRLRRQLRLCETFPRKRFVKPCTRRSRGNARSHVVRVRPVGGRSGR